MKTCTKCRAPKVVEDFTKDASRPDGRYPSCKVCCKEIKAAWYAINREQVRAYNSTPERRQANSEGNRKRRYGVTPDMWIDMEQEQEGRCAWCGLVKPLVPDHCHNTGAVRRLLCQSCNKAEGFLKDNPQIIAAIESVAWRPYVEDVIRRSD